MEDMAFKPHFLKRLFTTKSKRIWFPHQLWLFFKFSDELLIMKTNNRFCIDFPCWLLPDSRFVEQPLLSDWVILKWWITCVSFIQRGYGEVWPPMGKVILVFFFFFDECRPHLAVTLGLDISATGFKEILLMRNTKKTHFERHIHLLVQSVDLSVSNSYTQIASHWVSLQCITIWDFWGCDSKNIHETLEPWTDLLTLLMIRLWASPRQTCQTDTLWGLSTEWWCSIL